MKFDLKNILVGIVIGMIGTISIFLLVGDVDIQTDFQFGEKLDQDDMDISISIEKNIENGEDIVNIVATGRGSVTREDIEKELEKNAKRKNLIVEIDKKLLDEVINLVEKPKNPPPPC